MKKWFLCLVGFPLLLASCKKDDVNKCGFTDSSIVATAAETNYLQNYITTNAIAATQHSSGVFFEISNTGTGTIANVCSSVSVNYTGNLLSNGVQFDAGTSVSFVLGQLIQGWQKGLPLIKKGGSITLYIPPSLGYGDRDVMNGQVVLIPANSYLKFTIQLLDVQ